MGCVQAKGLSDSGADPNLTADVDNIFYVQNLDEDGTDVSEGYLELTPDHIELRQKDKECLKWPHRCLRRYGFNGDLFSFESGRKCSTGPGIFAFRCSRAETLYNCLEENIRKLNNRALASSVTSGGTIPNGNGVLPSSNLSHQVSGQRVSSTQPLSLLRPGMPRYETRFPPPGSGEDASGNYLSPTPAHTNGCTGPLYMNNQLPYVPEEADDAESGDRQHCYMNTNHPDVVRLSDKAVASRNVGPPPVRPTPVEKTNGNNNHWAASGLAEQQRPTPVLTEHPYEERRVHYAIIDHSDSNKPNGSAEGAHYADVRRSGSSSGDEDTIHGNGYANLPAGTVPSRNIGGLRRIDYEQEKNLFLGTVPAGTREDNSGGYSKIDFPKTEALNKMTADNHGVRKTRHDSSADDR